MIAYIKNKMYVTVDGMIYIRLACVWYTYCVKSCKQGFSEYQYIFGNALFQNVNTTFHSAPNIHSWYYDMSKWYYRIHLIVARTAA